MSACPIVLFVIANVTVSGLAQESDHRCEIGLTDIEILDCYLHDAHSSSSKGLHAASYYPILIALDVQFHQYVGLDRREATRKIVVESIDVNPSLGLVRGKRIDLGRFCCCREQRGGR